MPAAFAGLGVALPGRIVANAELGQHADVDDAWIVRRTGIRERRYAAPDDTLVALAARAASAALVDAGAPADEIDLVIVATATADDLLPNAAPGVAHAIGAIGAGAYDLGAACAGFVTACAQAAGWVESGRGRRVVVVGAEILSRHLDRTDAKTAPLFGDGAGAVVIERASRAGIGASVLRSDATRADALVIDGRTGILRMDGQATFRAAVAALADVTAAACLQEGVPLGEVDLFVFHQANARILRSVADQLQVDPERVVDAIAAVGNTSAASVPLALAAARETGRLTPGTRVLLAGVGAGFTCSALLCRWDPAASSSR
jgi:3-oxoacyl-[acyl-carrier-protein] synthase-3